MPPADMTMLLAFALAAAAPPVLAAPPDQRDGAAALQARRGGHVSLKEIERRIVPTMRGADYIGVDYDSGSAVYTLKFLRDGNVIWVDVDGRTGQVIGRTGR